MTRESTREDDVGSPEPPSRTPAPDSEALVALLEAMPEAGYVLDAVRDDAGAIVDFSFRFLNRAAETLIGRPREATLGVRLCELYPFHRDGLMDDYVAVHQQGAPLRRRIEIPGLPPGTMWYEQHVMPTAEGVAIAVHDVTREAVTDKAHREVEERARQAQHIESLGMLASGVAHDFNNILLAIGGFAEIGLLSLDGPRERLRELLEEIRGATDKGATLTRQVLGLASPRSSAPRAVDLNAVVSGGLGLLRNVLGASVRFESQLAADELVVTADESQLLQALVNLLVNARDAMPEGGEVHLRTEQVSVPTCQRLTPAEPDGCYARVTVRDTGRGMDEATRQRIFEPFFTTKDVGEGTGLGLALVHSTVARHGGFITVQSAPGSGTTFVLDFPLGETSTRACQVEDAAAVRGDGETVLIVDDDDAVRVLVAAALERLGYRALVATGGREAVDVFARQAGGVDLVLLDADMPDMDGRQTCAALRQLDPGARVLFWSGYEPSSFPEGYFEGAVAGVLRKPFDLNTLAKTVRSALEGRAARGVARAAGVVG